MKRIFLVFFLLAATLATWAQYSDLYYHRVGDTIEWKSEIGYYTWWEWQAYYENHLNINVSRTAILDGSKSCLRYLGKDSLIILQRFYTPMPLKIIGIAGVAFRGHAEEGPWVAVEDSIQEYFLIYDAVGDSFPLVAEVPWSALDTMRTLHIRNNRIDYWPDTDCCSFNAAQYYLPLLEYYLDSAIYVDDSFYVGGSMYGFRSLAMFYNTNTYYYGGWTHFYNSCHGHLPPCDPDLQSDFYCMPMGISYKVKGYWGPDDMRHPCPPEDGPDIIIGEFYASPWRWMHEPQPTVLMIYPIIEVDTTVPPASACVPVENVQVAVDGTAATVTWDDFPNYTEVRLRYGFAGQPQSTWTEVDVTGSTLHTLTGLLPSMPYGVTVRATCDKKETGWTAPVTFFSGTDTTGGGQGTEGVDETMLSRLTFLAPNPARDEVTVTSSFNLSRIDIYDLRGVLTYSEPVAGHDVTLPLDFLRAGTYIVGIHTHNGTTHKRLVVSR